MNTVEEVIGERVRREMGPVVEALLLVAAAVQSLQAGQGELLAIPEACRRVKGTDGKPISEMTMHRWIKRGHVETKRIGNRTFVVAASLAPVNIERVRELVAQARAR